MLVLGIDAHKRSHTIVAVDERGRRQAQRTINATTADHLEVIAWAEGLGEDRLWAIEDCRHLSRRFERDLLGAGERLVRVPTKMMPLPAKRPGPTGSQTRSTPSLWPEQRCKNPICRWPSSTGPPETSVFSSTTARTSSRSGPGSSTVSAGTSTSSTRPGSHQSGRLTGRRPSPPRPGTSKAGTGPSPAWPGHCSSAARR